MAWPVSSLGPVGCPEELWERTVAGAAFAADLAEVEPAERLEETRRE